MKLIPYLPSGSLKWPRPQWVPLIESVSLAFDLDIPLDIQISKPTIISIWSEFILFYNWLSCINLSINYKWYPENLLIDIICTYIYIYTYIRTPVTTNQGERGIFTWGYRPTTPTGRRVPDLRNRRSSKKQLLESKMFPNPLGSKKKQRTWKYTSQLLMAMRLYGYTWLFPSYVENSHEQWPCHHSCFDSPRYGVTPMVVCTAGATGTKRSEAIGPAEAAGAFR